MILTRTSLALASLILTAFCIAACSLDAQLSMLQNKIAPSIKTYEVKEITQEKVVVEILGKCPSDVSTFKILVDGIEAIAISKFDTSIADLNPGDVSATCSSDHILTLRYGVKDPNIERKIIFSVASQYKDGLSSYVNYDVDYKRPLVPAPVILTNNGMDFSTNALSPALQGACISDRVASVEYKVNGGPWISGGNCNNDLWLFNLSSLSGNPAQTHTILVRSLNPNSVVQNSESIEIKIEVDRVPPATGPTIQGVLGGSDMIADAWLGATLPKIQWLADADHKKIRLTVVSTDEATIYCPLIDLDNTSSYEMKSNDCIAPLDNMISYKIKAWAKDRAGNLSTTPTDFTFTVDRTLPFLNLTSKPQNGTHANFADIAFTMNSGGGSPLMSPTCSLDGVPVANCTSPVHFENLQLNSHTFSISVSDVAGNLKVLNHTWNITADTSPPLCHFTSADLVAIKTSTANFSYVCSDDDEVNKVRCSLNNSAFTDCDSFTNHSVTGLTDGTHIFKVQAYDLAGNPSSIISDDFIVDSIGPVVTLTLVPPVVSNATSANFLFSVSDGGSGVYSVRCILDNGTEIPCSNSYTVAGPLSEGTHSFLIKATDLAGNDGYSTPYSWTVDLTAPNPPILPANTDGAQRPTWTWTSGGGGGNGTYRFKLNDTDLSGGTTETTSLSFTPTTDLPFGAQTLYVQERDAAGNWSTSGQQTFAVKCSSGQYLASGACHACSIGTFQPTPGLATSCLPATSGHYVSATGQSSETTCTNKPLNAATVSYAASSALTTNSCPLASVDSCDINYVVNGLVCRQLCGVGQYWDGSSCSAVNFGYYSPSNDDSRYACPLHSNTTTANSGSINDCLADAGFFNCQDGVCDAAGLGYYSPGLDNTRYSCPLNSTTLTDKSVQLSDCLGNAGYFNCEDGLCDPVGYGFYSAGNSNTRIACPNHRSTSSTTSSSVSQCLALGGYYGSDTSTTAGEAGSGYYSPHLDNSRYQCPAGTYGSSLTNSTASCDGLCQAGYYCPIGSTTPQGAGACPAGYSCPAGTGDLNPSAICGTNQYSSAGSGSCTFCPANSATSGTALTDHDSINDCKGNPGYYNCQNGSCDPAGIGYYSPGNDNSRYQCTAGSYGSSLTNSAASCDGICAPGFFCPSGSGTSQGAGICNANSYSIGGASNASCTSCPVHSSTVGTGANQRDSLDDCLGDGGYYSCETGTCGPAGIGYYSAASSNIRNTCPVGSTTLTANASSLSECLGGPGLFNCEDGTCDNVGAGYYSPNNDNLRYACPANSFTTGVGTGADNLADCLAGTDYFDNDSTHTTAPIAVGVGYYSPYRDDSSYLCTNKPAYATSVAYSGSGNGTNNCPISAVLTCDVGYAPAGTSCSDDSPGAITFNDQNGVERSTLITSNSLVVDGFDGPLTATCNGCSAIARNGIWSGTTLGGFMPGDTITLRVNSSGSFSTSVISSVTLGSTTSSNWVVSTRAAYSCTGTPWGTLNHGDSRTGYSSNSPTPPTLCSGISQTRTCNDGVLSGTFVQTTCTNGCATTPWGNVTHGYSNTAYSVSAAPNCAANSEVRTCNNGSLSGSYTLTSCSDNAPDAFSFTNLTGINLSATADSNQVTLTGFDGPLTATCSNCLGIARNGVWSGTTVTGFMPGDTITLRQTASSSFLTAVTTTVTVGVTTSSVWSVQTRAGNSCTVAPWGVISHATSVDAYSSTTPTPPTTCSGVKQTRTCTDGTLSGTYASSICSEGCTGTPWGSVASGYAATAYTAAAPTGACVSETRTCSNGSMSGTYTATSCSPGCSLPWGGGISTGQNATAYQTSSPAGACVSETRSCSSGTLSGSYTASSCNPGCVGTPWGNVTHGYSNTAYASANPVGACVPETRTCSNGTLSGSYTATTCSASCSLPWGGTISSGNSVTAYATSAPAGACASETRTCNNGTLSGSYTSQNCTAGCAGTAWGNLTNGQSVTAYASNAPAGACVSETRTCSAGTLSGSYGFTSCNAGCTGTPWGNVTHGYSNTAYAATLSPNCAGTSQVRTCSSGTLSGSYTATSCSAACPAQNVSWGCMNDTPAVPLTPSGQTIFVQGKIFRGCSNEAYYTCSGTTWIRNTSYPAICEYSASCD